MKRRAGTGVRLSPAPLHADAWDHRGRDSFPALTGWCAPGDLASPPCGSSSTGRAAVSKTAGCRFESCLPCQPDATASGHERPGARKESLASKGERGRAHGTRSAGGSPHYSDSECGWGDSPSAYRAGFRADGRRGSNHEQSPTWRVQPIDGAGVRLENGSRATSWRFDPATLRVRSGATAGPSLTGR